MKEFCKRENTRSAAAELSWTSRTSLKAVHQWGNCSSCLCHQSWASTEGSTSSTAELCDLTTFERLEALLGCNNSLTPTSTHYSQNYSRIIGTGLHFPHRMYCARILWHFYIPTVQHFLLNGIIVTLSFDLLTIPKYNETSSIHPLECEHEHKHRVQKLSIGLQLVFYHATPRIGSYSKVASMEINSRGRLLLTLPQLRTSWDFCVNQCCSWRFNRC